MPFNDMNDFPAREFVDLSLFDQYTDLSGKCLINLSERALKRMRDDMGSIIFISAPGCNMTQPTKAGPFSRCLVIADGNYRYQL